MRWLKHFSDAYSNMKMQQVLANFGTDGYGFFWICSELVAQQGENFRIKREKNWKNVLSHVTGKKIKKCDEYLDFFAEINLIDKKGLEMGDLYLPKMQEYADEYTRKIGTLSGQTPDNVGQNRIEQNRTEQKENSTAQLRERAETFSKFFEIYPKKKNREEAQTEWLKIFHSLSPTESKELQATIVSDVHHRLKSQQWTEQNGRYIPQAAKYLAEKQWENPVPDDQDATLTEAEWSRYRYG